MSSLCKRVRQVDISAALLALASTEFLDTRGSNGHVAEPEWLDPFIATLEIPGVVVFRTLRKLPAYQGIPPHMDLERMSPSINVGTRYQLPLVTHPLVTMEWPEDGESHHLEAGWLYEVDYTRLHEIVHRAPVDRVHLQINVR